MLVLSTPLSQNQLAFRLLQPQLSKTQVVVFEFALVAVRYTATSIVASLLFFFIP